MDVVNKLFCIMEIFVLYIIVTFLVEIGAVFSPKSPAGDDVIWIIIRLLLSPVLVPIQIGLKLYE